MKRKEVCPECGRLLRTKGFKYNKLLKKKVCTRCDKRHGHNKYYEPEIRGSKRIRTKKPFNYSITRDEDKVLYNKKGNKEGVDFLKHYINKFYQKKRYEERRKKVDDKEKQKKFVEGLKQG